MHTVLHQADVLLQPMLTAVVCRQTMYKQELQQLIHVHIQLPDVVRVLHQPLQAGKKALLIHNLNTEGQVHILINNQLRLTVVHQKV